MLFQTQELSKRIQYISKLAKSKLLDQAESEIGALLARFPKDIKVRELAFNIFEEQKKHKSALMQAKSLRAEQPKYAKYHLWCARMNFQLGKLENAVEDCAACQDLKPSEISAHLECAVIFSNLGKRHHALSIIQKITCEEGRETEKFDEIIYQLLDLQVFRQASDTFRDNFEVFKTDKRALTQGLTIYRALNDDHNLKAVLSILKSNKEWRRHALYKEAIFAIEDGKIATGRAIFEKLIKVDPKNISFFETFLVHFSNKNSQKHFEKWFQAPELKSSGIISEPNNSYIVAYNFCSAYLARATNDVANFYKHIKLGHQMMLKGAAEHGEFVKKSVFLHIKHGDKTFQKLLQKSGITATPTQRKYIFIVGLPRSGSSLIQQMLLSANTATVVDLGESGLVADLYQSGLEVGFDNYDGHKTKNLFDLAFQERFNIEKNEIVIDKSLQNLAFCETLLNYLKNSKIIICEREIIQNIYSIFSNNLIDQSWTHSLYDIVKYCELALERIQYLKQKKHAFYVHNYEAFTSNPSSGLAELADFTDLEISSDTLKTFTNVSNKVSTASLIQVRQPIRPKKHMLPKEFLVDLEHEAVNKPWLQKALKKHTRTQ